MKKTLAKTIGAIAVAALSTAGAPAQTTGTWNVDANGNWSAAGNWSGGVPSLAGDTASLTYNITAARTVTLDTPETVGILNIGDPTASFFGYTLSGTSALTLNNNGGGAQLNQLTSGGAADTVSVPLSLADNLAITNVNGLTLSGAIDGSGAITKAGAGTLTLSSANTYGGGTTVGAGVITFGNSAAFGSGAITANGGTIKNTTGVTTANNLVANSGTTTLDVSGGNWTFNGNLSGSGAITRGTAATMSLYLNGDDSGFTGTFTSPNSGNAVVRFTSTNAGSVNASWVFNQPTAGRTDFEFNGAGTISFGSLTGSGPLQSGNATGTKTISAGALGLNDTFSGIIANGSSAVALTKVGSGTMTLSGANTYTGDTTISAGILAIGGAGKLGGGNYFGAIINNGSFNYNSSAAQTLSGSISGSGSLTNNSGATLALSGPLSGSGTLVNNGTGTLLLSGPTTFTGNLTANAGTLLLATPQSFSPNAVVVNDGATLSETFSPSIQMTAASVTAGFTTGATLGFVVNSTSVARITAGTLTLNGANTINIIGGNLAAGSSYPLITYTTLAGSGSYALGTLPAGVAGNLSTSGNTIYFNVTGVTNTIWTGAVNGTWDINTTANWTNAGTLGNTYLDGSLVQFDDTGLNTTTISNSVATTLSPLSVLVTNNVNNYAFKTNVIIAGAASLTKTGTANLTNSTPNTYTGPTVIDQGQLVAGVASVANVSGALGNNSAVTLANDSTALLNLNNFATQIGSLSGGGLAGGNVALGSATLTMGADNTSTTYGGVISGTGGFTKIGTGTLTLSGTNTFTGAWAVNGGTLNYNGSLASSGALTVNGSGANSIVNIGSGANIVIAGANHSMLVGNNASGVGAVFQSGGSISTNTLGSYEGIQVGSGSGAYGYYNLSGGTVLISELDCGGFNGQPTGVFDMTGGTMTVGTWFIVGRTGNGGGASIFNMTGGTANIVTPFNAQFMMNWTANATQSAVINVANATLNATNATGGVLNMMRSGTAGELAAVNLLSGGVMQVQGVNAANTAGTSHFNFNGGTLKASTANANFVTANVSLANVYSGGGTIDNNGVNITIPKALSAPTGSGLNGSVTLNSGGSGYIGAPAVTISGGGGTGATAYATVSGGAVTGVVITSPGVDYSSTPTVVFTGGGGSGASATAPTPTANISGGMTFQGSGTTTLTGVNTYTGGTKILGGTLVINTSVSGAQGGGDLVVSNATLNLDASSGSPMAANNISVGSTLNLTMNPSASAINGTGNLTLGDNATNNLAYGTVISAPSLAAVKVAGTLANGTNIVFNVSATGLQPGWIVPLIEADSTTLTTNGFVLGTLPAGIKAVLTNSTPNTLGMLVVSAGQLLTWHGSEDGVNPATNWDIAISTNWNSLADNSPQKYQQYLGNTIGDNVIFADNALYTDGTNHVNVLTNVVPATVIFSATTPYELHGAGGIGGATSVALTNNYAAVYLNTSNSYTGGTLVAGGTLVITNDNALGDASGGLTLAGGALELDNSLTSARAVTVTTNSTISVATNATVQLTGAVNGGYTVTKSGDGTLSLPTTNVFNNSAVIQGGALVVSGAQLVSANAGVAGINVADLTGDNAELNISSGAVYGRNSGGEFTPGIAVGNASGAAGSLELDGSGTVSSSRQIVLGNATGSYGAWNQTGGTAATGTNTGGFLVVGAAGASAVFNQSGGAFDIGWNAGTIAAGDANSLAVMNLSGGIFNSVATSGSSGTAGGLAVGEVGTGVLNVSGSAQVNLSGMFNLLLGRTGTGSSGTVNLLGGTLQTTAVTKGAGTGNFNFNGGTLKAGAASSTFMGGLTRATVYGGGAVIDDGGNSITISQPLLAPAGYGVGSISLSDGGSGYIAPPVVTISGGMGSNATAVATISGGIVTGITVTCPGSDYGSGDSLSVSFTGGGASVIPPTVSSVSLAPVAGGGLTKLGTGTLTLNGANTYTGNTVISAGKLLVTSVHQATNSVSVANGAGYGVSLAAGPAAITNESITLASGATTLSFGLGTNGNPIAPLIVCGPLTNNGTLSVTLGGSVSAMTVGSFPLMKYAGAIQGGGSLNPVIAGPQGSSITLSNSATDSTLYAVVNVLGGGIVWAGTNANPALTNLWDLNSTTNWLSGGVPTTYQETAPPGDAVVFNDLGSGLVLLSNTASPASLTISNNSVSYSFQGTGHVSGSLGLTKLGTGSATLAYTGDDFTGPTVISNGVLNLVGGSAIGDFSAVTLADVATAGITITNGETIGSLAGGGASGGNVVVQGGTLTVGGNGASTTYAGGITGAGSLTKNGNGALTLSGPNIYTGPTVVRGGALNVATGGVVSNTSGNFAVGTIAGTNATLSISGGAVSDSTTTGNAWASYLQVGNGANFRGAINLSAGSLNAQRHLVLGNGGGYGAMTMSGGTLTVGSYFIQGFGVNSVGVFNQTGGSATQNQASGAGATLIGSGNGSIGEMNVSGGTFTATAGGIFLPENGTSSGILNISGTGAVTAGNVGVKFGNSASAVSGTLNLLGGTLTANVVQNGGASSSIVNFNGGTLKASGNNASFMTNLTAATIYSGGATIDDGGYAIGIGQTLADATGYGVASISVDTPGAGYLNIPVVTISGGTGTNATAIAQVDPVTGTVTNILVTSPGSGYNNGDVLTVTLSGGGATTAATAGATVTFAANTSGHLTKVGAGTLTLSGTNTYTGATVVSNGTLLVNGALAGVATVNGGTLGGTGTIAGAVTNNAMLAPGTGGIGALTINGNLALSTDSTNLFTVNGSTPTNTMVVAGGNVTYGGLLSIAPTGTFTLGQQFQLFSGPGATNASAFAGIAGSPGSGLAFSFTNGVLSVVAGGPSGPANITNSYDAGTHSLSLSWPAGQGWRLEAQTNSLSTGLSPTGWSTVSVVTDGSYNAPVDPASPTVFYRLVYP